MKRKKSSSRSSLEQKIAEGRRKLQEAYNICGCTDSRVLAASIRLDKLINRYQRIWLEERIPGVKARLSNLKK